MTSTYYRKGFGLKSAIEGQLTADYSSAVVDAFRANQYRLTAGPLSFRLAREFGFCYGVDRAVDYAYETRTRFPDRKLFLVGEIIHNPHVNDRLRGMGITILERVPGGEFDFSAVTSEDVVLLPAFGVSVADFQRLRATGTTMVDTTCGSVLNVWKRVESYARDGFTALIHGKVYHEETRATASQVTGHPGGRYLVVLDMAETRLVCDAIEGRSDPASLATRFGGAASPGFDFARDLERIGVANQTTMLAGESLAIAREVRESMVRRHGEANIDDHFRSFDTICSATQDRQDAVRELLRDPPDLMIVVGGYNSSNTTHLAALCREHGVRTYHIEDADAIELPSGRLRHQPKVKVAEECLEPGWLSGVASIGVTAGASTPNNKIGETVIRLCAAAGVDRIDGLTE
ncbi:MAG: 4-hydroxy-3-methylbut-2-enyl diphosphate reductase [Gemmatimonadota bacterium]|nr:4-hydroxy-3-methylbut-2-enyl diphosphate reductase [Gemmatimonadota bacterium]MDH5284574.1 4-hydroxy-3-methylbut-2-enyl diphosphate reductase [Gemmatimonadota bacterium]